MIKKVVIVFDKDVKGYSQAKKIYKMVERLFCQFDNPLEGLIKPGDTVVIKPNLVKHVHDLGEMGVLSMITNGAVLRPIIDRVLKLGAKPVICDTPLEKADFKKILEITGIDRLGVETLDLRQYKSEPLPGDRWQIKKLKGDPLGYVEVDLGKNSAFTELDAKPQNYHTLADHTVDHFDPFTEDRGETNKYHYPDHHKYLIAKTILDADVIISVPKLKTHAKAGVTLSLKNTIGIVPDKIYLPHHRPGMPPFGDAFLKPPEKSLVKKRKRRLLASKIISGIFGQKITKKFKETFLAEYYDKIFPKDFEFIEWGSWYGNDTLWRTILDLNKILLYADEKGKMHREPQRRYFAIIDGIIGQEGNGPMAGDPMNSGVLIAGYNPVEVDSVGTQIMGFDPRKIPSIRKFVKMANLPNLHFKPPKGWESHIEL